MECAGCSSDLDHCHGTVILHEDATAECTEPDCRDLDEARHTLRVSCAEIEGGCACAVVEEFARAS